MTNNTKKAISVLLLWQNYFFINNEAAKNSTTKTAIVNKALSLYRQYKLKKEIQAGFENQNEEDISLAMSDFDDYASIID